MVAIARDAALTEAQVLIAMNHLIKTFGREKGFNKLKFMLAVADCWEVEKDRRRLDQAKYELRKLKMATINKTEPPTGE